MLEVDVPQEQRPVRRPCWKDETPENLVSRLAKRLYFTCVGDFRAALVKEGSRMFPFHQQIVEDEVHTLIVDIFEHPRPFSAAETLGYLVQSLRRRLKKRITRDRSLVPLQFDVRDYKTARRSLRSSHDVDDEYMLEVLEAGVRELPEDFREVVYMRLEGKRNKEIAIELGISHLTVATRYSRAKDFLRAFLTARLGEDFFVVHQPQSDTIATYTDLVDIRDDEF